MSAAARSVHGGESRALAAITDRVNILGVGATPLGTSTVRWRRLIDGEPSGDRNMSVSSPCRDWSRRSAARMMCSARSTSAAWRSRTACRSSGGRGWQVFPGAPHRKRPICSTRRALSACRTNSATTFYGASPKATQQLINRLLERHPGLCVAGHRSPPLRPQSPAEDAADIAAINEAEPDFVSGGAGHAQAGKMDGRASRQDQGDSAHRRRRRLPLPRGRETTGSGLDAASGAGMVVPLTDRAAAGLLHRYLLDNLLFIGHMLQQATGLRKHSPDV